MLTRFLSQNSKPARGLRPGFRPLTQVVLAVGLVLSASTSLFARPADAPEAVKEKEQQLIAILRSNAEPAEKAITCKRLAIYGSAEAVPALAPLLANEELASWARIALEAIPGPAADEALRNAAGQLQGRLLVGVLNSIGVRHDQKAVPILKTKLQGPDAEVASAAAVALGDIGGSSAASALTRALSQTQGEFRSAVAQGCMRCADHLLAEGKYGAAQKIYDKLRSTDIPPQRQLEATRGSILARKSAGVPLLLEQLRASDKAHFNLGLGVARELPGLEATAALASELKRCDSSRQPRLLMALGDRNDPTAWPAIVQAVNSGSKELRLVAIGVIEHSGNPSSLPVLLQTATDPDHQVARAALASLTRLPGNNINAELLRSLENASGKTRPVLLKVAGQRHIDGALPILARSMNDSDEAVRTAAIQGVGDLGGTAELQQIAQLLAGNAGQTSRSELESALLAISSRQGQAGVPGLLPLMQSSDVSVRTLGLHALASAGGSQALGAVADALNDKDENMQDEAARTLSSWPNTWPDDNAAGQRLLEMAQSASKPSYQVLGLRGYLQFLQNDKQLKPEEKADKLKEAMPLLKRPEEKQLALAVLRSAPSTAGLELLAGFGEDSTIAEDAWSAVVDIAARNRPALPKAEREKSLQMAMEKSGNESTRKKAEAALNRMK